MLKELSAANVDIYVDQGDTYYKVFTVKDGTGTVVDLTGLTIEANIKRYFNTGRNYPVTAALLVPASGTFTLSMTELETNQLVQDRYVYAVKLRSGADAIKIMGGQVLVASSGGIVINNNAITGNAAGVAPAGLDPVIT